jgi:hypothetical protein
MVTLKTPAPVRDTAPEASARERFAHSLSASNEFFKRIFFF